MKQLHYKCLSILFPWSLLNCPCTFPLHANVFTHCSECICSAFVLLSLLASLDKEKEKKSDVYIEWLLFATRARGVSGKKWWRKDFDACLYVSWEFITK